MFKESTDRKSKVLIVEDDRNISRLISYNLSKKGFSTECAYDGYEAQDRLAAGSFDAVILDVMLPGIDGFHICKSIKQDPAAFNTFVVILSARAESQDKIYGGLVGADCYITKPFSIGALMDTIGELTSMRQRDYRVQTRDALSRAVQREEA